MRELGAIRTSIPGPWGPFHLAATERGVVAVAWLTTAAAFEADLRRRLRAMVAEASEVPARDARRRYLDAAVTAVETLIAGRRPAQSLSFDLADRPAWDRDVLAAVARIPWGRTASYGEIARQVGAPRAARAVGGAVGRNPISLLIPCHRVIAGDGGLGGYGGDAWGSRDDRLAMKRELLAREGISDQRWIEARRASV
jgi:methylated-DNA-[protein]-cysteine S-methyltransferase